MSLVIFFFAATCALGADRLELREGSATVEGRITAINAAGVLLQREEDSDPVLYRWDRIRQVHTQRRDPELEQYRQTSIDLWRARSRLERNDAAMAEDLFAKHFETYRGQTHETALLVSEGLLRCLLARGAHDRAVIPALETIRLHRAIPAGASVYQRQPPVIDERTQLCTVLPPVWVNSLELSRLERELRKYDAGTDTVVASFAMMYQRALRLHLGMSIDHEQRVLAADHEGVRLLRSLLDMSAADGDRRHTARQANLNGMQNWPHWQQAWVHYFAGMSLLSESGTGRNELGLVQLAHLPARFGSLQPYLAGLALAKMAEICDAANETAAAASLRSELSTRFPHHPVLNPSRRRAAAVKHSIQPIDQTMEDLRNYS